MGGARGAEIRGVGTWQRCLRTSLGTKRREDAALPVIAAKDGETGLSEAGTVADQKPFTDSYVPKYSAEEKKDTTAAVRAPA
jgi:hypothetical protein